MLSSILFVSTSPHLLSTAELLEIMHAHQKITQAKSVTGILLYKDGNFMSVLEGPEQAVIEIFWKIETDPHHQAIMVISKEFIEERQFSDWKMSFVDLDPEIARRECAYSDFLENEDTANQYRQTTKSNYHILLSFKENIR